MQASSFLFAYLAITALLLPGAADAAAGTFASGGSGPGESVFSSIMHLWNIAPEKFRPVIREEEWQVHKKRYKMTKSGIEDVVLDYDIAEFGDERARVSEAPASVSKDAAPDYVITATKTFATDAACLAYYKALVDGFAARLVADKVRRSDRRDHVFFKDKQKKWERKLYVKQYTKQKGKQKPRIVISVRVTLDQ